ncbi:Nitrogen assimilation transcription factor nit-4 [Cytospora mali]|uniref:Nitrogen assimilation transcription factor nit-4 n=1 Tax=Cytospora mali TaxID=578113 RepID=A0A194VXN5_CYTMA|nr:Nitrogen assimilation transcription factor nit-4 [Valsa mali]
MDSQNFQLSYQAPDAASASSSLGAPPSTTSKKKSRGRNDPANQKRRCVSTACIACRKRKSKCDGALPSCAACASVYGTECIYDPNSDHRRKGVYREKVDSTKARSGTLQVLIDAILNAAEDDVPEIVRKIRTCDSLDDVAESISREDFAGLPDEGHQVEDEYATDQPVEGERDLARKMGELRLENGAIRYIGGTSHLIYQGDPNDVPVESESLNAPSNEDPMTSWSEVTKDRQLVTHLMNMYWNWHYPYFTTLSKSLFWREFLGGKSRGLLKGKKYCSSLLVNAMLALGCHFTDAPGAYAVAGDSRTKGDHFFAEAKRLIIDNDEYEKPRLVTVQALALMSVREAGCAREAKGWVYSGMSFRMAQDIGLNLDAGAIAADQEQISAEEIDARRITFWGCFLFDKCWSNYLGRLPQLPKNSYNVPKYDVFPNEDGEDWSPYTDSGFDQSMRQPARTRAMGLQLSKLCEISSDLLLFFYHPNHIGRSSGKAVELKKLSELHRRLEDWRKELPQEFEPKEGQLPNVILMHMFYHLQYIHLFRPFLKYIPSASPLPPHVSPRRICSANAGFISKLMRLYKKLYNLRQICNIAVYMVHSACTIHLLNVPEKTAKRDIIHGVKHLEEIAEDWLCARRTLSIISVLARKWNCELPEEAAAILRRTDEKYGYLGTQDVPSPHRPMVPLYTPSPPPFPKPPAQPQKQEQQSSTNPQQAALAMNVGQEVPTSLSPDMLSNLGAIAPAGIQEQSVPTSVTSNPSNDPSLSFSGTWGMPGVSAPAMPRYHQSYAPVQMTTSGPSGQSSRSISRQVTPNSIYAIDGQDWFLKDGINWQQNFEGWGLGASPTNSSNSGGGGGMTGNDMFMFKGLQGPGLDMGGSWDFDSSMTNLDRIPGLD